MVFPNMVLPWSEWIVKIISHEYLEYFDLSLDYGPSPFTGPG